MTKHLTVILATGLLLFGAQAHALQSDKDQPMDIAADRVDIDDNKGISTFRGNVQVTRGTLRMSGEVVVVHRTSDGEMQRIVATGKQAMYRQRPDNKPQDVIAHANRIVYNAKTEIVDLKKQARVVQGGDTFSGEHLVYNARQDKVTGSSDDEGRVRVRLQPKAK
ncbi:MAG: lipopolysaccharide transport periplasmic protein LptA [Granulosicoccaceae bacterium]|jgi:lipopolysaccharide export system protein LptA